VRRALALFLLVVLSGHVAADFLTVSRRATVKREAHRDAEIIGRYDRGQNLALLDDGQRTNGYYKVRDADTGEAGFIYKTLARRHRGDVPTRDDEGIVVGSETIPPSLRDEELATRLRGLISQNTTRISFGRARRIVLSVIGREGSGAGAVRCVYSDVRVDLEPEDSRVTLPDRTRVDAFKVVSGRNVDEPAFREWIDV